MKTLEMSLNKKSFNNKNNPTIYDKFQLPTHNDDV